MRSIHKLKRKRYHATVTPELQSSVTLNWKNNSAVSYYCLIDDYQLYVWLGPNNNWFFSVDYMGNYLTCNRFTKGYDSANVPMESAQYVYQYHREHGILPIGTWGKLGMVN
jgi:hypothetical protein